MDRRTLFAWLAPLLIGGAAVPCAAQTLVHFPSLDGAASVPLDGYLLRASDSGRRPAIVLLHGCGGLLSKSGQIVARDADWAQRLNGLGLSVLLVDSLGPRGRGQMCAPSTFDASVYAARSRDAYAALRYLQAQPFVAANKVAVMGWSQGGGALLRAIQSGSAARGVAGNGADFAAAVAFYPASCSTQKLGRWTSPVPLHVLVGDADVWTPAAPCQQVIASSGTQVTVYPGAYHDFDWPGMKVHAIPAFRTLQGVVPIEGEEPAARADAIGRVTAFLSGALGLR